jgi:hypothetical protein
MLIPLQLALDYPINWSFDTTLRDFVQNFYDSIGCDKFERDFHMSYTDSQSIYSEIDVVMQTYGRPFDYQWLIFIGASTKTGKTSEYIGQYGEGFKMGVLSCMQHNWCLPIMESADWIIKPCVYTETIDGKSVKMLGYDKERRIDDGYTRLTLKNLDSKYKGAINEVKLNFFYPGNLLLGDKIVEFANGAIYERSNVLIPGKYADWNHGILFCNYMARAKINLDLAILVRIDLYGGNEERSRSTYTKAKTKYVIMRWAEMLDSETSYVLLVRLKKHWNDMPQRTVDLNTWYYLICQLVRNVSREKGCYDKFVSENCNLAFLERKTRDSFRNAEIDNAQNWIVSTGCDGVEMVNPIFRLLGAKPLLDEYYKRCVVSFDIPSVIEMGKINILYETIENIFGLGLYDERPLVRINNKNEETVRYLNVRKLSSRKKADMRKREFETVIVGRKIFEENDFCHALQFWFEILLFAYGTSRSGYGNVILTEFCGACIENIDAIKEMEDKWNVGKR